MSLKVEVDWAGNGDWTDVYEDFDAYFDEYGVYGAVGDDVTSLVRGAVSVEYGRDQSAALAPTIAGRGGFALDNSRRFFTSRNTDSPLFGLIKPARPVRISRLFEGAIYPGADTYPASTLYPGIDSNFILFRGHTDDNPLNPQLDSRDVSLSLVDALADFRGVTISTELYSGVRTGTAIGYVLDAAGWTGSRDLDAGATFIPWWWEDQTDALEALERLVRSEGPPALLTVGSDGGIIFKDRHHRHLDSGSLTSQTTWHADEGQEPTIHRESFSYDEAWRNIVNTGQASISVRKPGELAEVWAAEETFTLSAGETRTVIATATDPFYDAVTPVDGTDYTSVVGSPTVGLSRTSGLSTTVTISAGGAAAVLTGFRLRARPVATAYTVQVSAEHDASIVDYGRRGMPGDLPWCNQYDAQSILTYTVEERSQPLPIVSARFMVGVNETRASALLPLNLSDRVTIDVPELDLDADFYVENIGHTVTRSERDHAVTFGTEAAPVFPNPVLRFDTAGAGFDDGKFATLAVEPGSMFIFDGGVGHRFGEGLMAA